MVARIDNVAIASDNEIDFVKAVRSFVGEDRRIRSSVWGLLAGLYAHRTLSEGVHNGSDSSNLFQQPYRLYHPFRHESHGEKHKERNCEDGQLVN